MKKLLLGLIMLFAFSAFAQEPSLPIDMENPADDAWLGDGGAVYSLETVLFSPNTVGKIIGGNDQWNSRVDLALGTYIDMTTASKTFTFEIYTTEAVAMTGLFQISLEKDGGYPIEMQFTTDGAIGWETITLDFIGATNGYPNQNEPVVYGNYAQVSIFTNFGDTGSSTYYFDDVAGAANGIVVPSDPLPAGPPIPQPTAAPEDVISIYSDVYTDLSNFWHPGWGQTTAYSDEIIPGTLPQDHITKLKNFNYEAVLLDGSANPTNIGSMENVHIDIWSIDDTPVRLYLLTGPEPFVSLPLVAGQWNSFDIPLEDFIGANLIAFWGIKFESGNWGPGSSPLVYFDNIYFWRDPIVAGTDATLSDLQVDGSTIPGFDPAIIDYTYGLPEGTTTVPQITLATPTDLAVTSVVTTQAAAIPGDATVLVTAGDGITTLTYTVSFAHSIPNSLPPIPPHDPVDVFSIYSDTYTDLSETNFNPWWNQSTIVTIDDQIAGNSTLKYENLNYQGTNLGSIDGGVPQNVSGYEFIHVDFWTYNATALNFFLLDQGAGEVSYSLPITPGQWVSVDIPLSHYSDGGEDLTDIHQFKVDGGDGVSTTVWFDNYYFWKTAGSGILTFNPEDGESNVAVDVNPTLSFSSPVKMADGSTISGIDIPNIITLKETDASGADVPFTGTINPSQDIITVIPTSDFGINQTYYLALDNDVIRYQGGLLIAGQDIAFSTIAAPLTLPVTFGDPQVNYGLTDFGGTVSNISADPSSPTNSVVETIKSLNSETWAGTTVGEPTGLTPAVPFEEGSTVMSIRVYSPSAGIPVLFKLEDWENAGIAVETISNTTVANEWETLYFDFSNENPGTPPLDLLNSYNKPVVFFNYGVVGADETYYWDDIQFIGDREIDLKVFLEGPFNGFIMNASLNPSLLPLSQPFNTAPWNYSGTESVASIPNTDVVDWILIELRDAANPELATSETMVGRQAAFLLRNGTIVGLDGASTLIFDVNITEGMFVVVWHRNHLQVLSASELQPINGIYTYNFTSSQGQAFNGNLKELGFGNYGMYGGNGNVDDLIDELDKISVWEPESGQAGYLQGDYNMDGQVDNQDKDEVWLLNNGAIVDEYQLIWQDEFDVNGAPDSDK